MLPKPLAPFTQVHALKPETFDIQQEQPFRIRRSVSNASSHEVSATRVLAKLSATLVFGIKTVDPFCMAARRQWCRPQRKTGTRREPKSDVCQLVTLLIRKDGPPVRVLVLGAGQMGYAIVKDMLLSEGVTSVGVADISVDRLAMCKNLAPHRVVAYTADVTDVDGLVKIMKGYDVVCAALLHKHSPIGIKAALKAGVSLVDLVGSRIEEKMALDREARSKGITIIPGAGVAPGLSNILVAHGASQFDEPESGTIYVGGIPLHPRPPLQYSVVFALETVLNTCVEKARVLRNGKLTEVPALSEVESVDFPEPPGRCEAFVTEGLSTLIYTMQKRGMKNLCEKTVRYPGYTDKIKFLIECGLFDDKPVTIDGMQVVPRRFLAAVLGPKLALGDGQDVTAMRVVVTGKKDGSTATYVAEMLDYYDVTTGLTSMARTTAFPCNIIARAIVSGEISKRGVVPVEEAVDEDFFPKFKERLAEKGVLFTEEFKQGR